MTQHTTVETQGYSLACTESAGEPTVQPRLDARVPYGVRDVCSFEAPVVVASLGGVFIYIDMTQLVKSRETGKAPATALEAFLMDESE